MRSAQRKVKPVKTAQSLKAVGYEVSPQTAINWKQVFDAMPEGISVHSADSTILYANGRLAEIYDKPLEEIIGSRCDDLFHRDSQACPHEKVIESRKRFEINGRQDVGDKVYSISLEPIFNQEGRVAGFIRLMRDVTERQRAQEELLNTERFATLGQMIAGIAHDVGTPLNIISGYCEYLLMRSKPEEPGHREISTILHQTRRIADFIKQMLDLARPAQARADAIGLKGFLTESMHLMGHHLRKANVKASLVFNTDPPLIYGDAPRLRQALFSIFLNVSYQLGEGANLEIAVAEASFDSTLARIIIAGIDKEGNGIDFSQSFAGFLDPTKNSETLGMGLSLARHILDEIGARVESADIPGVDIPGVDIPGKGKALVVYIPKDSRASARQAV
jgi:PAS domain S-box-containing protein